MPALEDTRDRGEARDYGTAAEAIGLPGPDDDSVRTWVMEYVQLAETAAGERFLVVVAPLGSDPRCRGQSPVGGALGGLIAVVRGDLPLKVAGVGEWP